MEFEDEGASVCESPSKSSASSLMSKDKLQISTRGRTAIGRVRQRTEQNNISDDASVGSSSGPSLVVRGAGASAWAVQDAGTVQMLNDECSYLCSTLLSARSATQALETGLALAQLLSSKKSRRVLWQSCNNNNGARLATGISPALPNYRSAPMESKPPTKTVLDAILDVIALAGKRGAGSTLNTTKTFAGGSSSQSSLASNAGRTVAGSPLRARTKSARRKLKQQQLLPQDAALSSALVPSWWSQMEAIPELSQILAIILYYLSVDCTLSKDHSVAASGATSNPATARAIRMTILQHGRALQGILRLCLKDEVIRGTERIPTKKSNRIVPFMASTTTALSRGFEDEGSSDSSMLTESVPSSSLNGRLDPTAQNKRRRRQIQVKTPLALSPAEDSLSSLSFPGETNSTAGAANSVTPKARGGGDPTKAGRLNRRRRRLSQPHPALQEHKLPALPEGNQLGDDLDWPGDDKTDKILPPPAKRSRTQEIRDSALSFASEGNTSGTNDSSLFVETKNPGRKDIVAKAPQSPGDKSAAGSVASLESVQSLVTVGLTHKLNQLRSKVHYTSLQEGPAPRGHDADCEKKVTNGLDPWVSLLCLESLNRIITGNEGEEQSCIAEEPHENEMAAEDEESNPLLMTNRLLGESGVLPLMAKCLSQELKDSPISSHSATCRSCERCWTERISILGSLIDGACLFNKENRQSFSEHHDPFSFESDLCRKKNSDGLIFHILLFLKNVIPTELQKKKKGATKFRSADETLISGVRLLALRTLTSLTHDNYLASQQMTVYHKLEDEEIDSVDFDKKRADKRSTDTLRGLDVLTKLVFELETVPEIAREKSTKGTRRGNTTKEEESHLYDSTIFCLNTLANIIEAAGVRRALAETQVPAPDKEKQLWIQWLCNWLVCQTENFRDAIMSIGKSESGSQDSEKELEKLEEDKLVAAGNACVLLACLMKEADQDSEGIALSKRIRKVILDQMPVDKDGKSTGVMMIVNTLKAFCNYYHLSLGELSMAIIAPVKKLIDGLQGLKK